MRFLRLPLLVETHQETLSTSFITLTPYATDILKLTNVPEQEPGEK
jgi:hypothetical protein